MESCLNWDGPIAMVPCLHQGNINTKRKLRAWRDQKCIPIVGAITPLTYRPIAMGLCLYQGNIYTKRKQRAWRDQKCIPLVGAITPLTSAGRQNTPSRVRRYRAQNGKLPKLGRTYRHGTVFVPRKYLNQKESTGMKRPEMYSASQCNNPTYLCGPLKYPVSKEGVWAQNGKLPKLGRTYRHCTVLVPRKYLNQKEATGMEKPEMYSASRCNNPTYLCGPSKYPVSSEAV